MARPPPPPPPPPISRPSPPTTSAASSRTTFRVTMPPLILLLPAAVFGFVPTSPPPNMLRIPPAAFNAAAAAAASPRRTVLRGGEWHTRAISFRNGGDLAARSGFALLREYDGAQSKAPQPLVKEEPTRLQKLVIQLRECLEDLGARATEEQLETWAVLIFESMEHSARTFHSVQHVFDISDGADSIQTIGAFFHDIVYYSIDGGLSPAQAEKLEGIITETDEGNVLLNDIEFDPVISMVIAIFGFKPGQTLNPFKGLNEFLSAAVAVRCFEGILASKFLFQIVGSLEATIPFRSKDEKGVPVMERLFERLSKANTDFKLGLSNDEVVKTTQKAVDLANRDVANFATNHSPAFLSDTWNLLPESNISFRHNRVYRISDYTLALKKMTGFFENLDPEVVFNSFQNEPSDEVLTGMTGRAKDNIEIAQKYMHCKMLSISVLSALAEQTGGDGPVALFVGDLPQSFRSGVVSPRIEDFIDVRRQNGIQLDESVFSLLRDGRESESEFDIKNSPLAAFLYGMLGDSGLEKSLKYAVFPMDKIHGKTLLDSMPKAAVRQIASACAQIAITRARALNKIAEDYS